MTAHPHRHPSHEVRSRVIDEDQEVVGMHELVGGRVVVPLEVLEIRRHQSVGLARQGSRVHVGVVFIAPCV